MSEKPELVEICLGRRETGLKTRDLTVEFFEHTLKYVLDMNEPSQRYIYDCITKAAFYEVEVAYALYKHLMPGDTFIDVGAHCGVFSVLASACVGEFGRVISLEPNASNGMAYQRHANPNMALWQAAAGDELGTADIFINADNDGGHSFWDPALHPHNVLSRMECKKETVRVMPLDYFVGSNPSAIKIDTEGYEAVILRGAKRMLANPSLKLIVCELNRNGLAFMGNTPEEVTGPLEAAGFKQHSSQAGGPGWDNLIMKRE